MAGCEGAFYARGMCDRHYKRWLRHGSTDNREHALIETPGYRGAHNRVAVARGPASALPCIDCGGRATYWSLSWRRVEPGRFLFGAAVRSERLHPYTTNPADYDPRCAPDAQVYDRGFHEATA